MILYIFLGALYIVGYLLAHWMMMVDHKSENLPVTNGDKAVCFLFSLLSWLIVLRILVSTWIAKIQKTGYWSKAAPETEEHILKEIQKIEKLIEPFKRLTIKKDK